MSVITKVHALRGKISNALDYILNPEKSEPWLVGTSMGVIPEHTGMFWESEWQEEGYRGSKVGYHFIQSFDEPNLSPEQIYELADEWIKDCTNGEYDYVIAVHKNTKHTHAHIIVNPVNRITKVGWDIYYKKDLPIFREKNDKMCRKYGLEVLPNEHGRSSSWWNHQNKNVGDSDLDVIRKTIDYVIPKVKDYNDFKLYLQKLGFEVEDGIKNKEDTNNTDKYKNYKFTINEKMVNQDLSNDDFYFIRIPYSTDWMLIDKENAKWNEKGNTLECHMDFTKVYNIYNSSGDTVIDYERNGFDIANQWESKNKNNNGRQGLRIKLPNRKKFRRCKRIKNPDNLDLDYSLESILERINNNDCLTTDEEILNLINEDEISSTKQKDVRNTFYDNAEIKTAYNQSPLYNMTKREKYYYFKTQDIQAKLDMLAKRKESFDIVSSINELKDLQNEIKKQLAKCNTRIREIEDTFQDIQIQRMEGVIEMTDNEVSELIDKDLAKLKQESFKLKNQYSDVTEKIKKAEKDKDKFR